MIQPLTPREDARIIPPNDPDKDFWMGIRQALLMQLDMIERRLGITPTTAELRKNAKLQLN